MKIVEKIFKDPYYITSGWGPRTYWLNGQEVSDFHNGIDYGTNNKKVPQYAVEDGYIISCGIDAAGGNAYLSATTFKVVTGGNRIVPGCLVREETIK